MKAPHLKAAQRLAPLMAPQRQAPLMAPQRQAPLMAAQRQAALMAAQPAGAMLREPTSQVGDSRIPFYKLVSRETSFLVLIEVPGVDSQKIDLQVGANNLVISAESGPSATEDERYQYYGTLELPEEIKPDEARAEYKDGLLRVTLDKVEAAKMRKVQISETK